MVKAVCLFSGGLDSALAAELVRRQDIDVRLVNFTTPFFPSRDAKAMAKRLKLPLKEIDVTPEYVRMLRKPKHGYGSYLNPCIDCKIFMLRHAKKYAKSIGAKFVFTGEVIGQRPMSQQKYMLRHIEKEVGLEGKLLRPLSAKLMDATEAERWVDREKLMDIQGRGRTLQMDLAKKFKIRKYPSPAGGCLLTNEGYAAKAKDLLKERALSRNDIMLLKVGRHFRLGKSRIIVGRNHADNNEILRLRKPSDYLFEVKGSGSPVTLLRGEKAERSIRLAASLTARYSDSKDERTAVSYGRKLEKNMIVKRISEKELENLRIISFS